jgi:hypothetical protein
VPVLSWDQVAAAALLGGWTPAQAVIAVSITEPESGRNDTIVQAGQPYATTGWGLWQITPGNSVPQFGINNQLLNAVNNAKAGHFKWAEAGGFSPWTTWVNGLNVPFVPDAERAVAAVAHMSLTQLKKLVGSGGAPGAPTGGGPSATQDWAPQIRHASGMVEAGAGHLTSYATAISGIVPKFTPPVVTVPSPATLLWVPGERLPA